MFSDDAAKLAECCGSVPPAVGGLRVRRLSHEAAASRSVRALSPAGGYGNARHTATFEDVASKHRKQRLEELREKFEATRAGGPSGQGTTWLVRGTLLGDRSRWVLQHDGVSEIVEVDERSISRLAGMEKTWILRFARPRPIVQVYRPALRPVGGDDTNLPRKLGPKDAVNASRPIKPKASVRTVSGGLPTLGRGHR